MARFLNICRISRIRSLEAHAESRAATPHCVAQRGIHFRHGHGKDGALACMMLKRTSYTAPLYRGAFGAHAPRCVVQKWHELSSRPCMQLRVPSLTGGHYTCRSVQRSEEILGGKYIYIYIYICRYIYIYYIHPICRVHSMYILYEPHIYISEPCIV